MRTLRAWTKSLDRWKIHDEWQERYLIEYRAQRNFHAANLRFEQDATLEVRTTFRRPDTIESQVLRAEGSRLIRESECATISSKRRMRHTPSWPSGRWTLCLRITASATSVRSL